MMPALYYTYFTFLDARCKNIRDGPPRMAARLTGSGRERSSHSRFPLVPRVRLVAPVFSFHDLSSTCEQVVKALTHALERQQLHHAYLLSGTRGVGKTTLARILTKALNCETGISATP